MKHNIDFNEIKKIFFIGIGGIGMSALARFMNEKEVKVFGYDKVETALTRKLVEEGMIITYDEDPIWIPEGIDLVVVTPAIPEEQSQLRWFEENEFLILKRSEVLGLLSKAMNTIAVAGTHGKTSTSAIITHILKYTGKKPNAFLGGILVNYDSNYLYGESNWMVAEADEYDRSFLQLSPNVLVITSMDPDHLDIYGSEEEMIAAYNQLIQQIEAKGFLIIHAAIKSKVSNLSISYLKTNGIQILEYGNSTEFSYSNINVRNGVYYFDFESKKLAIQDLKSVMPGEHNIMNATAAITATLDFDLTREDVLDAMVTFRGISRRFEYVHSSDIILIDDYAHHPEELKHTINTILNLFEKIDEVLIVFQPHLYTRTRDFYKGFATELSRVRKVLLMPIYPARELPIEGINSRMIMNSIKGTEVQLTTGENLVKDIQGIKPKVVVTLGAADLDKYHLKIIEALEC